MAKKRSSTTRGSATVDIPDPSSGEFGVDDSMLVASSDDDLHNVATTPTRSPNQIDEAMILSDEEDEHRVDFGDNGEGQANVFVQDDEDDIQQSAAAKAPTKKMWTGRTKKNHANPANAAQAALMVDEKPWRSRSSAKGGEPATPKSPSRIAQLVMNKSSNLPPKPALPNSSTTSTGASPVETKRPLLNYIRNFTGNSPQQSPRRPQHQAVEGDAAAAAPMAGNWSDNEENDGDGDGDHSSISSEMISYSSFGSMDDSDDDMAMPLEDYLHHPEKEPGFWSHLSYVPCHFVYDGNNPSDMTTSSLASVGHHLQAFLDPEFKTLTLNDPSRIGDFNFVLDHRFFLRALFQLLAERDEVGVEDSIHDDQNIIKKGPLRKKYLGKTVYKYVELRKGNLVYFGDDDGEGRKTIHLRSATASCNAVDDTTTDTGKDAAGSHTMPASTHGSSGGGGPAMHQAAASLSAGLTSAVNATTSAASTIAGGTSVTAGFEFHLWVEGKRYAWLANSKNGRQSWVRAIRQAMIGDKVNDDDWGMTLNAAIAPSHSDDLVGTHEEAFSNYQILQSKLQNSATLTQYLESILSLAPHPETPSASPALQVPLKCLSDQMPTKESGDNKKDGASQRKRVHMAIAEFWDNLVKYDFAINGHLIDRHSPCAAERIIGSLVRCILDYDRCFGEGGIPETSGMPAVSEHQTHGANDNKPPPQQRRSDTNRISELDAVSYARSILLLMIKSKTSGDVEFAVDNLLENEELVRVESIESGSALSNTSDALHIDVSFAGDDVVDHNDDAEQSNEASGWVMVRRSKYNSWKSRFCVFSEGVFSYYENAEPRPHGLRGQLLLAGATLSEVVDEKDRVREDAGLYILRLTTKGQERERQFGFESEEEFMEWKEVIQHVVNSCATSLYQHAEEGTDPGGELRQTSGHRKPRNTIIEGGSKLISYATDESLKAIKGATGSSMKVVKGGTKVIKDATGAFTKGATNLMFRSIRSSRSRAKRNSGGATRRSIRKAPSLQFLMESTRSSKTGKREPTVQCVIQTTSEFRIRPVDPSSAGGSALITVRVKFLQAYLLSGGAHGRLARGDATIELDFIDETPRFAEELLSEGESPKPQYYSS